MAGAAELKFKAIIDSSSGEEMHKQLVGIVNGIKDLEVNVKVSSASLSSIQKQIEGAVKKASNIQITPSINANIAGKSGSGSKNTGVVSANKQAADANKARIQAEQMKAAYEKASAAASKYTTTMNRLRSVQGGDLITQSQLDAVSAYEKAINKLQAAIDKKKYNRAKEMLPGVADLGKAAKTAVEDAGKLTNAYSKASDSFQKMATRAQQYAKTISGTATSSNVQRVEQMAQRFQEYASGNFGEALKEWNAKYNGNGVLDSKAIERFVAHSRSEFERFRMEMLATGQATESFGQKLRRLFGQRLNYAVMAAATMYLRQAIRELFQSSIELESAFAQLQIVTGATDVQMARFKATASGLAQDLGKSVSDVAKSIEVFSRLGYNLPDASQLAKFATIMSNVAAVDTDAATTGMTSIIKGFDMDVENAEHVSDVLVDVGQKYAVSAGEMMEAFERSGAALNATGTSFEKSAGLIAAANAAVQNAGTVGVALKTVSARIRGKVVPPRTVMCELMLCA